MEADEAQYPDFAHTLRHHVRPGDNLGALVDDKGINSVFHNQADAQAIADEVIKRITAGGQKSQLQNWFKTKLTKSPPYTGYYGPKGSSLRTAYTRDSEGNLVGTPTGNGYTVILRRMKGHPMGFIVDTVIPK
ncbi:hypothetical protein [Streptomyces sp. YIM S03343]